MGDHVGRDPQDPFSSKWQNNAEGEHASLQGESAKPGVF